MAFFAAYGYAGAALVLFTIGLLRQPGKHTWPVVALIAGALVALAGYTVILLVGLLLTLWLGSMGGSILWLVSLAAGAATLFLWRRLLIAGALVALAGYAVVLFLMFWLGFTGLGVLWLVPLAAGAAAVLFWRLLRWDRPAAG